MSRLSSDPFLVSDGTQFQAHCAWPVEKKGPSVGIGISTRDRWDDLEITLTKIEQAGLHRCAVRVIDDGSKQPVSPAMRERFPWVVFERSPVSQGYIVQRNRLAQKLETSLYLSLDDDSFIEEGDVEAAAEWLVQRPDVAAICFSIIPGEGGVDGVLARPAQPAPIRFYIGCAHLVKRELFLELGGYREELQHLCEEVQFGLAAARRDYQIWHYPHVVARHRLSNAGRNQARAQRLLTRNDLYCAIMYFPFPYMIGSVLHCLPRQFGHRTHRRYWKSVVTGFVEALWTLPRVWRHRAPLSFSQIRQWRQAAHPLGVVELHAPQPAGATAGHYARMQPQTR